VARTSRRVRTGPPSEIGGIVRDESFHKQSRIEQEMLARAGFRDFDPVDMELRLGLIAAVNALAAKTEEELEPFGLSGSTFNVLMAIRHAPDGMLMMSEVARGLVLRPNNLTPLVDALVNEGYVTRVPSESDRRVVNVKITDSGAARLDAVLPRLFRTLAVASADLDEDEKLTCIQAAMKIRLGLQSA
jgi:DNA-binding MarR family transcriptional regulator